uniref:Uncharacterized protein n=1 Tax=Sphaerodactylus townsendi TaxID=933632 RepID=A0ACB8F075_9SAUR
MERQAGFSLANLMREQGKFQYVGLYKFEDPFEEEKAHARLRKIRQGSRFMSEYVSEFRQLAWVVQDWLGQVKIHFFREGLHPEVAQWAMVTAEPTSLAGSGGSHKMAGSTLDVSAIP